MEKTRVKLNELLQNVGHSKMTRKQNMITQADLSLLNRFNTEYEVIIQLTENEEAGKYIYSILIRKDGIDEPLFARNQKKRVFKSCQGLMPFLRENCHKAKSIVIRTDLKEFKHLLQIPIYHSDIQRD